VKFGMLVSELAGPLARRVWRDSLFIMSSSSQPESLTLGDTETFIGFDRRFEEGVPELVRSARKGGPE
jgi:hypothetical protein